MIDELGTRMKEQYELRARFSLPRRTYTIIRLDGKAFHTYTKGLEKPFDKGLTEDLNLATIAIMSEIQGAKFAYVQSDEISILLTDFADVGTNAWFDGNIQKICSVSCSLITAEFNWCRNRRWVNSIQLYKQNGMDIPAIVKERDKLAYFDSRVFTIPDPTEVMNYFIWRNQDCSRNSVSMYAQSVYSHKDLNNKITMEKTNMLLDKGINWYQQPEENKYGRLIVKEEYSIKNRIDFTDIKRTRWAVQPAWKFTDNKDKLKQMIPTYE